MSEARTNKLFGEITFDSDLLFNDEKKDTWSKGFTFFCF